MRREGNRIILETKEEMQEDLARVINGGRLTLMMDPLPIEEIFTKKGKIRKNVFKRKRIKKGVE